MEGFIVKAHRLLDAQQMSHNQAPRLHHYENRRVELDPRVESDRNSRSFSKNKPTHMLESLGQLVHKKFKVYTALTASREQILNAIANESYLKRSHPLKQGPIMDKTRYCYFHKDYGHTIEDCQKLKDEIEYHIRRGQLKEYVRWGQPER